MAYQLEFAEEQAVRELAAHSMSVHKGPANELRRAFDALTELMVGSHVTTHQAVDEYQELYLQAFQSYNRGDLHFAEYMARGVKHLCRAAWFDAKIKYLQSHIDDLPHVPGLASGSGQGIQHGISEVEARLSRLKLTGLADRFGHRCRKHIDVLVALPDCNNLLGDTYMKAAYEYCLAAENLHEIDFRAMAA